MTWESSTASSEDQTKLVSALKAYATGDMDARGVLSIANQGVTNKIKTLMEQLDILPGCLLGRSGSYP